jgi:hypothetical protein
MPISNLPDDWGSYYGSKCPSCGERSHPSGVGDCSCFEAEMDEKMDDIMNELNEATHIVAFKLRSKYSSDDSTGANIKAKEEHVYLYVDFPNEGFEEYSFTNDNWDIALAELITLGVIESKEEIEWRKASEMSPSK